MPDYHLPICPANADGSLNWQSGDGSGPYKLVEYEPGVGCPSGTVTTTGTVKARISMKFEMHHRSTTRTPARPRWLPAMSDSAYACWRTRRSALLSRDPNIEVDNVPSASAYHHCRCICDVAPYDNPDVRMALKLAINREELVEKVQYTAQRRWGTISTTRLRCRIGPADIPQREYDPEQAAALWKKAGMDSTPINISTAESITTGAVDALVLYAEHAKAAGININVVREPNDGYWSDVWLTKPWCMVSWGARPTPDVMYTLAYKEDAPWNETHWKNPEFNKLLLQGKAELDDSVRKEIYRDMAMILRDDGGSLIPYFPNFVYGRRSNVKHTGQLAASWQLDGARGASRWWFEG